MSRSFLARPIRPELDVARTESCLIARLAQRLPQHVIRKTVEDVSQNAIFLLMPNWMDLEVALVNAKRSFRLCQLDVRLPQFFGKSLTS